MKLLSCHLYLIVRDVERSARYFHDVLGFGIDGYNYDDGSKGHCQLTRDSVVIALHRTNDQVNPIANHVIGAIFTDDGQDIPVVDGYIFVDEVFELYQEFKNRGAKIVKQPDEAYMPQMVIEDLDGHRLGFIQHP